MQKPIYFDYNATTPTDPRVLEAMLPYFTENFGNSANHLHSYGTNAEHSIDQATNTVARFLNCTANELTWNSGATEGNNTVIFGFVKKWKKQFPNKPLHLITSLTEHSSVLNAFKEVECIPQVFVSYVKPDPQGLITLQEIKKHITEHTRFISLIWVNNEIGTINPICEIANNLQINFKNQIALHTDATQAIGKISVDLTKIPIHYLTFSSHKFYGPKGVGLVFQKSGHELPPLILGGGHQNQRRSGTLNTPGILGTAQAISLCAKEMNTENERLRSYTEKIFTELKKTVPNLILNGAPIGSNRSPINLSLTVQTPVDIKRQELKGIAFSQGSACRSGKTTSSHVLSAIGLSDHQSSCTLRLSLGRWTTEEDINQVISTLSGAFKPTQTVLGSSHDHNH